MGGSNGYKNMVEARTKGNTKRRKLDDYETPPGGATLSLLQFVSLKGPVFEPACGSGIMMKELRATGLKVTGADIKQGHDFLKRTKVFPGDMVTNPPYRDGLAERFARHALKLADGKVALLVQNGFLWGGKRAAGLFADFKPAAVIIQPERIYFLEAGRPIKAQFFSHAWVVWPERKLRERGNNGWDTVLHWAPPPDEF